MQQYSVEIMMCYPLLFIQSQLPPRPSQVPRLPPIEREEWESYRQIDGRITMEKEVEFRARVFAGVSISHFF